MEFEETVEMKQQPHSITSVLVSQLRVFKEAATLVHLFEQESPVP